MSISIVVVDDDETDRYLVKRAVKSLDLDLELIEFSAGDEFLEIAKDTRQRAEHLGTPPPPILVLLDINMPRLSGLEVLESLKTALNAEDQIFVVTMYTSSNHAVDRESSMSYDFVRDYMIKPITADRLEQLIREHCDGPV